MLKIIILFYLNVLIPYIQTNLKKNRNQLTMTVYKYNCKLFNSLVECLQASLRQYVTVRHYANYSTCHTSMSLVVKVLESMTQREREREREKKRDR